MILDLHRLEDGVGRLEGEHDVRFTNAFGEEGVVPCRIDLEYSHTGNGWYFQATLNGDYVTACHGCLDGVRVSVEGEFELVVRKTGDPGNVQNSGDAAAEYVVLSMGQHEVSLVPFIYENFVVNIPMIVRCREDCKGLCATCGTNLNQKPCSCARTTAPMGDALRENATDDRD